MTENLESQRNLLQILETALNASQDGFAIWRATNPDKLEDSDFELKFINDAGAAPTGIQAEKLRGAYISQIIPDSEAPALRSTFANCLKTNLPQHEVINVRTVAGWMGSYENTVIPLIDGNVLATFRDISREQAESQRMKWLVNHDSLTGLANRNLILKDIEDALLQLAVHGSAFAFGFFDIDNFKAFNDSYGHDFGDEILKSFANKLQYVLHGSDHLARLSGDEFAVVLNSAASEENVATIYHRFKQSVSEGWKIDGKSIDITFSAGFVLVRSSQIEAPELLRIADSNMYMVKRSGKNDFKVTTYA